MSLRAGAGRSARSSRGETSRLGLVAGAAAGRRNRRRGRGVRGRPRASHDGGASPGEPGLAALLRLAAGERARLVPAAAIALLRTAAALALPAAAGAFAAEAFGARSPGRLALFAAAGAGLLALHAGLGAAEPWLVEAAQARIARRLRRRLFARLQGARLPWLEARRSGELGHLFAVDADAAALPAAQLPVSLLTLAATGLGALLLMARIDPVCAAAVLLAGGPLALLARRLAGPVGARAGELAARHGALLGQVQESLAAALAVRLYGAAAQEAARLARAEAELERARERHLRRQLAARPASQLVAGAGALALACLALARPGAPPLSDAELVSLVLYALVGLRPLLGAASLHMSAQEAVAALARLAALASAPQEPDEAEDVVPTAGARAGAEHAAERAPGALTLEGVRLARGGRAVLRGAELRLAPGQITALVGANGAGKSSLARLLVRLLEPGAGRILLDGRDLAELPPRRLRRQVVLASQETQILDRSVRENLTLGLEAAPGTGASRAEVCEADLWEALRRAGALEFVRALPDGLETRLGEGGARLSGGQRQRLALARALLREPRVLVLDEATSMLDADGERRFLDANRAWLRRRSVLLVTHRPETLARVDRVLRLEAGRLVEEPLPRARPVARRAPLPPERAGAGAPARSEPV